MRSSIQATARLVLIALVVLLTADTAEAQRKAGRNGGVFLEIGVGARAVALGSAVTALANDANQIFWNPAGTALSTQQSFSAALSHSRWIADLNYTAAAAGYNLGVGTATIGIQHFGVSDIPANRQNGYTDPILQDLVTDTETSETFSYSDIAVSASFSRYFFDRLTLGTTFKVVNESIDGVNASAVAFDFGSIYRVGLAGWQIAARLNNLGTALKFYNQDNPLPLNFSIGTLLYPISNESVRLMVALDATKPQDSQQLLFGGAELSFYDLLFVRGGYRFNYAGASDGGTANRPAVDTTIEKMSLGGGLQYEVAGNLVSIDYAFTQMDLLNDVHQFTLQFGR